MKLYRKMSLVGGEKDLQHPTVTLDFEELPEWLREFSWSGDLTFRARATRVAEEMGPGGKWVCVTFELQALKQAVADEDLEEEEEDTESVKEIKKIVVADAETSLDELLKAVLKDAPSST